MIGEVSYFLKNGVKLMKTKILLASLVCVALLSACGGAGGSRISLEGEKATAETPSTGGTEADAHDEIITPSGTGTGSGSDTGSVTGENVGTGTTGGTTGGETPPADTDDDGTTAPTAPTALTATIHATKMFDTRLGLVRMDWTVAGGDDLSELYIYSGGFYRVEVDASEANPCGEIADDTYSSNGNRLLLVHSNGDDLNAGSQNYNQWSGYLGTAQKCTEETCNGYVPEMKGAPVCRMDLKDSNGSAIRSGTFYTRVLEDSQTFKLYAKTSSGEETSAATSAPAIDPVDLSVSMSVQSDDQLHVSVTAKNVLRKISITSGCKSDSETLQKNGEDDYIGTCPFKDKQAIALKAYGIGSNNTATRTYKVNIVDTKKVELKDFSDHNCKGGDSFGWPDCEGTLSLAAHVSAADYTIKDQDGNVMDSGKTYAGLGEVKLYSNADKNDPIQSKSVNKDGYATFKGVSRNHDHYIWHAKVGGVESNDTKDINGLEPYKASFEMDKDSWYNKGYALDHCAQGGNFLRDGITWKGKNIDHIAVSCHDRLQHENAMATFDQNAYGGTAPDNYDHCATAEQPVKASYDSQHGLVWVDFNIQSKNFGWRNTCSCDFTATAYDGETKIHRYNVSWENECVVHSKI
jgi:hypothetical protein